MSVGKRIKDAFKRYLSRLEKENRETFGSGVPDCCKLNRNQPQKPIKKE